MRLRQILTKPQTSGFAPAWRADFAGNTNPDCLHSMLILSTIRNGEFSFGLDRLVEGPVRPKKSKRKLRRMRRLALLLNEFSRRVHAAIALGMRFA
jgi:hypothetical protein